MASLVVESRNGDKLLLQPGDCYLIEPFLPKQPSRIARIVSFTPTRNPPDPDRVVCTAQIFVGLSETIVLIETEWDSREVFLTPELQNVDISRLVARVEVVYRAPNPDRSDVAAIVSAPFRYYYSWVWDKVENAFVDPPHVDKKVWKDATDVLDLYAGCGGLSYGFDQEGMHVQWAVEWDKAAAKSWVKNHPDGRMFCCSVVDILKFIKAKGPDRDINGWKHIFPEDAYWTQPVEEVFGVRFDESKAVGLEFRVRFKDQDEKKWVPADEVADDVNVRIWKKKNEDQWKPLHKRYREIKRYSDKDDDAEAELADAEMALDKQEEDIDEDGNAIEVESDSEVGGHHVPDGQWKVKEVKDIRINKVGMYEYLVGWEGYSSADDTWEPEHNIRAGTLVEKFLKTAWTKKLYPCKKTVGYIVGGPPCQGFSKANYHRDSKHPFRGKNRGVSHFLEYVSFFEPRGILVENVAGMLDHADGVVPRSVMKQLLLWGYQVRIVMASSACYGVPQRRWRVLIIAAKSGEYLPKMPEPTHWVDVSKWKTGGLKPLLRSEWSRILLGPKTSGEPWAKCPDIQQAINDLPPCPSVHPKGFSLYASQPRSNYQKLMRKHTLGNVVWNNKCRTSSNVYAWKIYEPTHLFVTITCSLRALNEPAVHPIYQRPMSIREHARGQSFPDHFHFTGTQGQIYMQIGNAVPCLMARAIARAFIAADKLLCPDRTWQMKEAPDVVDEDPDEQEIAEMERKFAEVPKLNEIRTEEDYEALQGLRKVGKPTGSVFSKRGKPSRAARVMDDEPDGDSDGEIIEDSSDANQTPSEDEEDQISIESDHSDGDMSDLHSDNSDLSSSSGDSISDPEEVLRQLRKEIEKQERRRRGEPSESSDQEDEELLRTRIYISKAKKAAASSRQSGSDDDEDSDDAGDWYSKEKRKFKRRKAPIVEKPLSEALKEPKVAVRTRGRAHQEKITAYVIESSSDGEGENGNPGEAQRGSDEISRESRSKKRTALALPTTLEDSD